LRLAHAQATEARDQRHAEHEDAVPEIAEEVTRKETHGKERPEERGRPTPRIGRIARAQHSEHHE
jgi:hypothetical protein